MTQIDLDPGTCKVGTEGVVLYAPNIIVDPASNIIVRTIDDGSNLANPDYTSLRAARDDGFGIPNGDFVAEDVRVDAVGYPFEDDLTGLVLPGSITTDVDHYLTVRPVAGTGARESGWQDSGVYTGFSNGKSPNLSQAFTVVRGIQLEWFPGDVTYNNPHFSAKGVVVDGCRFRVHGAPGKHMGGMFFRAVQTTPEPKARNCIVEGMASMESRNLVRVGGAGNATLENCTLHYHGTGDFPAIVSSTEDDLGVLCRNVVITGAGLSEAIDRDGFHPDSTNCATFDDDASGVPDSLINVTAAECFVDPNNGDFRPRAGSPLIGAGVDLSGEFETAIGRKLRRVPFDIGAAQEELQRAGSVAVKPVQGSAIVEVA